MSERRRGALTGTVLLLGLTSLLTDLGSDMITPLLPAFVVGVLGAPALAGGLIEGAADTVSSLLRYPAGRLADRLRRRKPLVVAGYALSSLSKPLVAFATSAGHVLLVRLADRVGKGVRSAPRDALIADSASPGTAGLAFGFHRGMDHAGAVLGPLLAAALLASGMPLRDVFLWAGVPGLLAVASVMFVREPRRLLAVPPEGEAAVSPGSLAEPPRSLAEPPREPGVAPEGDLGVSPEDDAGPDAEEPPGDAGDPLPRRLRSLLLVILLFSLAASSDFFVLLRAQELGVPLSGIPLLAAALSVVKMIGAPLAGRLSDRVGRLPLVAAGWGVYAASYAGLALSETAQQAVVVTIAYGTYHALTEPTERALVADLAPGAARGRAFGAFNAIVGVSALPAALLTGALWDAVSPEAALWTCAGVALLALAALGWWRTRGA